MGQVIVLRSRDMWRFVQETLSKPMPYLDKYPAPGSKHASKGPWLLTTRVDVDWVDGDPMMQQMLHDMAQLIENKTCVAIAQPMMDSSILYGSGVRGKTLDNLSRDQNKLVMDTLKFNFDAHDKTALESAQREINDKVKEYRKDLEDALTNYGKYCLKEGVGVSMKFVSTLGGAAFTGIGIAATVASGGAAAPLTVATTTLGVINCVQNIIALGEQIVRLSQEAEQMEWEINAKLTMLEAKHSGKVLGSNTGKIVDSIVEGVLFGTVLKGTDGIIGINFKAIGDLIERYGHKVEGIQKKCHAFARNLDALLKRSEMKDANDKLLTTEAHKAKYVEFFKKVNAPGPKWDFFGITKEESVKRAQKINTVVGNVTLLFGRIQLAKAVYAGYTQRLTKLDGGASEKVYKWTQFGTGVVMTGVGTGLNIAGMGSSVSDLVQTINGGVNDWVTGPGFDLMDTAYDSL